MAEVADLIIIDDRNINHNGYVQGQLGRKPVWTTIDLIAKFEQSARREHLTALRRSGLCFVPLAPDELTGLMAETTVEDGRFIETAELRAVRENLIMTRMLNTLQLPQEHVWFDRMIEAFIFAIKAQWQEGTSEQESKARAGWLLEQFDIRGWAHRRPESETDLADVRYRAQAMALMTIPGASRRTRTAYWRWLEEVLIERLREEEGPVYDAIVDQVIALIREATERGQGRQHDG
jgi:hypothetical protein